MGKYVYTLSVSVLHWPTMDQNLFFCLNLYEIVHVTIIYTRKKFCEKKKRQNRFRTVNTVFLTHAEISISSS